MVTGLRIDFSLIVKTSLASTSSGTCRPRGWTWIWDGKWWNGGWTENPAYPVVKDVLPPLGQRRRWRWRWSWRWRWGGAAVSLEAGRVFIAGDTRILSRVGVSTR